MQFRAPSDHFPVIDTAKKNLSTSSSTSSVTATGSGGGDKKTATSHSIISSLKRLVSDVGNNNGIGNTTSASSECREELDGVERGEGTPLSHLTASRAKAPRRRPPSSQHLRHHAAGSTGNNASPTVPPGSFSSVPNTLSVKQNICENINISIFVTSVEIEFTIYFYLSIYQEENISNGRPDTTLEQIPDEETDGLAAKARRKAPWVTCHVD